MSDALGSIELQTPSASAKKAAALQVVLSANPYQLEYVLGGHPLPLQLEWVFSGAQTDFILIPAPGAGTRTTLTMLSVLVRPSVTVPVFVRIGFGTTTIPAESTAGTPQVPVNYTIPVGGGGIIVGNGSAPIAQGAPNQPLRLTMTAATGNALAIAATYFQPQIG